MSAATNDLGEMLRKREERKREEDDFVDEQVEELRSTGITNIIDKYGTDDLDNVDRLWWRVLGKMVDEYMMR